MQISYVGVPPKQTIMVQIYYWEHDQSEERPLDEFFRGEDSSLVQWQPPAMGGLPVAGMPMQGMPLQMGAPYGGDAHYQGVQMGAPAGLERGMFGGMEGGSMDLQQAAHMLGGVRTYVD